MIHAIHAIPSPPIGWSLWQLGPVAVHTYALCLLIGMAAAVVVTGRRLQARHIPAGFAVDAALWAVPFGLTGARVYHVLTHTGDYFGPGMNPWLVFAIWDGGNALYGSLIGGAIGAWIACRRAGVRLWSFADALAPGLLVGQAIGRLGNWFNHELFGLPTSLPWGLEIEPGNRAIPPGTPAGTVFQPLFLYEMLWNLIGAVLLVIVGRYLNLQWGRTFGLYLIWYGLARAGLEAIRLDPTSDRFLGIPANDWGSFAAIAIGIILIAVQSRHSGPESTAYRTRPGEHAPTAQQPTRTVIVAPDAAR